MPAADTLAALAAVAVHGRGEQQQQAALELTRSSADPQAFAWWWLWLASAPPEDASRLVEELPCGLALPVSSVPAAVDALTSHDDLTCSAWVRVRSAVLHRLDPHDPGSCDLATLVACAPDTHPDVLVAALELLVVTGHPSRQALLRAAETAVVRATPPEGTGATARLDGPDGPDADAVVVAATILSALAPAQDEPHRRLAARCAELVERCTAPDAAAPSGPSRNRYGTWALAVLARLRS